jgi:dTDP-4-dehydrorhamnose 3,5-epimerase
MIFHETKPPRVFEIDLEPHSDERGFFARSWCQREFREHGLNSRLMQCNISFNRRNGTLRGMHFHGAPHSETTIVRCRQGVIYEVVLDLRLQLPTFKEWISALLTVGNRNMLYSPVRDFF